MEFSQDLIEGRLIKRYKRFLADVELCSGEVITAHTANTGAMTGCAEPGSRVWLSVSDNPKRKYAHTWELVEPVASQPSLVGINTLASNTLVREAIEKGVITELSGYETLKKEVRYGVENSRIDLLLQHNTLPDCYIEVKNVTLIENSIGYFPDAVTARGTKHLRELIMMAEQGYRAVIFYCVQCEGVNEVRPARHIDEVYSRTLDEAVKRGVEPLAYSARVSVNAIELVRRLPVGDCRLG